MTTTDQITLDVTDIDKTGNELHLLINNAVKGYKNRTLPSVLVLNQKQFNSLTGSMEEMYQSDVFMFQTPYSVMEVVVEE